MNIKELKESINKSFQEETSKEGYGRVSFSQYSLFAKCPKSWELAYGKGLRTYLPSIHTAFGTAFHEVLQEFLQLYLEDKKDEALSINLKDSLKHKMFEVYTSELNNVDGKHFSTPEELAEFYKDGCDIINFLNYRRDLYFDPERYSMLGIEAPLFLQAIETNDKVNMLSFVDIVLYDKKLDRVKIVDIKTSTRGWGKWAVEDEIKVSQVYLYRHYFSKQYGYPIDKIDVEFFIVIRKLDNRIQIFTPPISEEAQQSAVNNIKSFIDYCFNDDGSYNLDNEFIAIPGERSKNCKFCEFKDNYDLCPKEQRLTPAKYRKYLENNKQ